MQVVDASLHGVSSAGPIEAWLPADAVCLGRIEETANSVSGRLDLPSFAASGAADMQFELMLEWSLDNLVRLYNALPLSWSGVVTALPAGAGDQLALVPNTAVPLLHDELGNSSGFAIVGGVVTANATAETDVYAHSVGEIVLALPNGGEEVVVVNGLTTFRIYHEGLAEGHARDDDGDGLDEVVVRLRGGEPRRHELLGNGCSPPSRWNDRDGRDRGNREHHTGLAGSDAVERGRRSGRELLRSVCRAGNGWPVVRRHPSPADERLD